MALNLIGLNELQNVIPAIVAKCKESVLSTTSATNVLTYTTPAADNFSISCYVRVITAATNLTITVNYTDAGGAQSTQLYTGSTAVGSYHMPVDLFINAAANTPFTLTATAGTANQVYISADITRR
jgi:hypothetical protein